MLRNIDGSPFETNEGLMIAHPPAFPHYEGHSDTPDVRAMLLSALIEAIRARGWHYKLESQENETGGYHQATIYDDPAVYVLDAGSSARAVEPCDALLGAYVQALQAAEEVKVETK